MEKLQISPYVIYLNSQLLSYQISSSNCLSRDGQLLSNHVAVYRNRLKYKTFRPWRSSSVTMLKNVEWLGLIHSNLVTCDMGHECLIVWKILVFSIATDKDLHGQIRLTFLTVSIYCYMIAQQLPSSTLPFTCTVPYVYWRTYYVPILILVECHN